MWVFITHPGAQSELVPHTAIAEHCSAWEAAVGGRHLTIACIRLLSNIVVALCNPLRQNPHT